MCEPTTILAIASVASTVSAVAAQAGSSRAQGQANQVQYQNSVTARSENANQIELRRQQEADAAGQSINSNNLSQREAMSTVVAQGGPSGLSMDALLGSLANKGATYNESVNQNLQRTNIALDNQLVNVNRNSASEINSLKAPAPVDYLGAALRIGNTLNGAGMLSGSTAATPTHDYRPNRAGQ